MTAVPSMRGHVRTDRPHRYLKQFGQHAAGMNRIKHAGSLDMAVETSPDNDVVTIVFASWGRCRLTAVPAGLVVDAEADSTSNLRRIVERVERNLDRFSGGELTLVWDRTPRRSRTTVTLVVIALAMLAIHLGVGAYVVSNWQLSAAAAVVIALAIVVKVAVAAALGRHHVLGRH